MHFIAKSVSFRTSNLVQKINLPLSLHVQLHRLWSVNIIVFICRGPKIKAPIGILKLPISPVHPTQEKLENILYFYGLNPSRR